MANKQYEIIEHFPVTGHVMLKIGCPRISSPTFADFHAILEIFFRARGVPTNEPPDTPLIFTDP